MNTFFTSDLHLGHKNIIELENRPFKDLEDMNNKLVNNWNSKIKNDDLVYYIGDFCFLQ
jgi:calcineurin-like phosphoesterase family protein